ncbi:MAG: type II toxin-antitoxin system RelE/ParE family toxin [Planctomycetaceae bacterium]|jgi:toxin ParE1/3/4|nr:type II toxin-antitoxin system RelE/ParE family toxin [Planctomycetaceae bacterium]
MQPNNKQFTVFLTDAASRDLDSIYYYIAEHRSVEQAIKVIETLEQTIDSLKYEPERCAHSTEFLQVGIQGIREILSNPYRIFFRMKKNKVIVFAIIDGRRDLRTFIVQRYNDNNS